MVSFDSNKNIELGPNNVVSADFADAIRRSNDSAAQELAAANAAQNLVTEAEGVARNAADPQKTEQYMDLEGFNELFDKELDMPTARFLLKSSGVEIDPVSGDAALRWEDEPPVIVPGTNNPTNN